MYQPLQFSGAFSPSTLEKKVVSIDRYLTVKANLYKCLLLLTIPQSLGEIRHKSKAIIQLQPK